MNAKQRHSRPRYTTPLVGIVVMFATGTSPARAQQDSRDMRSLIEQALGEPSGFTITNKTLGEAIGLIAEQTGVPLRVRPGVMDLAPHGAGTMIREVQVANMPLREGLARVLAPLGMTFVAHGDHVEILANEWLSALGRRITWDELDTLSQLASLEPGRSADALAALKPMIQFRVPLRQPWTALSAAVRDVGAGSGEEVLERACKNLGWTWTLDGKRIVVTDGVETIRHKLAQRITLRMTNRPLLDVLHAIGERIGVAVHTEPGIMASLPRHLQQNFSLSAHDDAASQVIDTITAYTGLGYLIEPGGILFFNAGSDAGAAAQRNGGVDRGVDPPTDADPIIAKMTTTLEDGKTIDWLIRRSELPSNLREMRKKDLAELFRTIRRVEPPSHP